jgi:uncharacterized protein YajQ (UPF0234 family)
MVQDEVDQTQKRITITCKTEEDLQQVLERLKTQRLTEDEMRKALQSCIAD